MKSVDIPRLLGCISLGHPRSGVGVAPLLAAGASHFEDILVGVVPPWLPSSAQNRGNHGGIAPTRSVKSLKWDAPLGGQPRG
ncbi:MAG: hypothetical protein VKK80_13520 [Prochlorothrix sp.]|nr:hypothetical protein [Prochlorothrix sp.]